MKVTLVFPPNRNIPSSPFAGLSLLAGCMGKAGHDCRVVDANLEAFDLLIQRETLQGLKSYFDRTWDYLRGLERLTPDQARQLQGLAVLDVVPYEHLYHAERAGEILRTRELFLDPEKCNWAYDVLANVIRAAYSINPIFYPLSPTYLQDFFGYLERDIDNPISQLNEAAVLDKVLENDPDMVAVSITFNEQTTEAFAFLKQLKARAPHVKTLVGGSIISAFQNKLCKDPRFWQYADYAIVFDGDESFPALATALEQGADLAAIPNLWFRNEAGEIVEPANRAMANLNELATPDFSTIPLERYFLPYPVINYQTSRGCYYGKCTFCSDDIKANFRYRRPELVIEDVQEIRRKTGARHMMFWDPLTPPRLMREIAKWNSSQPEDERFYFGAETKFEPLFTNQSFTDLLYEGGARFLQFGFESGSQRVLDLMVKGNDLSRVHLMLDALQQSNIAVSVQWFIGFPDATEEEDLQSYRYLDEHRDQVLLSSYMGMFALSPDDDIFRSGGDMYDIDLFQRGDGMWDFRHRDGRSHYDRQELDAAMLSRGDAETINRMHFYVYLTEKPERVREVSNFERRGMLPERIEDLAGKKPFCPKSNHQRTYDFDIFTPPEEQGITDASPGLLREGKCHALFVTQTQVVYPLSERDRRLIELADGTRTVEEIVDAAGGDRDADLKRLFGFVRRGLLVVPHAHKRAAPRQEQPAPAR